MIVREITSADLPEIAYIHRHEYKKDHFTSRFPVKLLEKYYAALVRQNQYCFLAEDENKKILGAGIAGDKTKYAIKEFIKANFISLFFVLITNPEFIISKIKGFNTIFLKKNNFVSKASMRYLTFVVREGYKGTGVAKNITLRIEDSMRADGIKLYGHSIKRTNDRSTEVMVKNGSIIEYEDEQTVLFIKYL